MPWLAEAWVPETIPGGGGLQQGGGEEAEQRWPPCPLP